MLREQGARINSDGVNAISAGLTQRMKHADAAVQSSAAILLIPCGGPRRLNRSSWIIQREYLGCQTGYLTHTGQNYTTNIKITIKGKVFIEQVICYKSASLLLEVGEGGTFATGGALLSCCIR